MYCILAPLQCLETQDWFGPYIYQVMLIKQKNFWLARLAKQHIDLEMFQHIVHTIM